MYTSVIREFQSICQIINFFKNFERIDILLTQFFIENFNCRYVVIMMQFNQCIIVNFHEQKLMFAIIIVFADHLSECNDVNHFKASTSSCIEKNLCEKFSIVNCEKLFQIVDEIRCNELTKHVQKLQRNEFVKCLIECFVNNDKMKIVEMTLQSDQYFKSLNWIFHCSQIKSKSNFNHLINSLELIVNLKMICSWIKQTNFELFENCCSHIRQKLAISIRDYDFRYISVNNI